MRFISILTFGRDANPPEDPQSPAKMERLISDLHASGTLIARQQLSVESADEMAGPTWPPPDSERIETEHAYERLAELGLDYGPAFQGLRNAWRRGEEIFAEVSLAEDERSQARPEVEQDVLGPGLLRVVAVGVGVRVLGHDEGVS